jgi:hypothetical protein
MVYGRVHDRIEQGVEALLFVGGEGAALAGHEERGTWRGIDRGRQSRLVTEARCASAGGSGSPARQPQRQEGKGPEAERFTAVPLHLVADGGVRIAPVPVAALLAPDTIPRIVLPLRVTAD